MGMFACFERVKENVLNLDWGDGFVIMQKTTEL